MARDATARLYDVDEDSIVFKKFGRSRKYDHGSITFRSREDRLIDLDQLHESIWATRLSGGTRSGLVSLVVTAVGKIDVRDGRTVLKVNDSAGEFVLDPNPDDEFRGVFEKLQSSLQTSGQVVTVTGRLDGWAGRWPQMLKQVPPKPRTILVTDFEIVGAK